MNKLHIPPLDEQAAKAALEHQKILAKPPLALGKLEPVAIQIAAMTGNPAPTCRASSKEKSCTAPMISAKVRP